MLVAHAQKAKNWTSSEMVEWHIHGKVSVCRVRIPLYDSVTMTSYRVKPEKLLLIGVYISSEHPYLAPFFIYSGETQRRRHCSISIACSPRTRIPVTSVTFEAGWLVCLFVCPETSDFCRDLLHIDRWCKNIECFFLPISQFSPLLLSNGRRILKSSIFEIGVRVQFASKLGNIYCNRTTQTCFWESASWNNDIRIMATTMTS